MVVQSALMVFCRVVILSVITGCSILGSGRYTVRVTELNHPLQLLQKLVVESLPRGHRTNSPNGREFMSKYYQVIKGSYKDAEDSVDRFYAHVAILGDRRPYVIEIKVLQEERVLQGESVGYERVGYSLRLAKELEKTIRLRLTKRREDLNIIDDFRAF